MEIVYLGILSTIFNWVFDKILSPVFKFIAGLLETVLGWLFNNVLGPLLQDVLWPLFTGLLDVIFSALASILYTIFASILELLDSMQQIFNLLAGVSEVTYNGKSTTLLEAVFQFPEVRRAFVLFTFVGIIMAFMFATLAVSKNFLEMDTENSRPLSKILSSTLKTMVRFMIIPLMALFLIQFSGLLLKQVSKAISAGDTSLARTVFVVASLDAVKDGDEYNISTSKNPEKIGISDPKRKPFYDMNATDKKNYWDKKAVSAVFDFAKFDYLIGFAGAIFLMVVLCMCLLNFVSRIFEVILLYIVSPFFVSVMPLDDGEKFKAWQEMFLGKIFSGFGSVFTMQMYMMLCPVIMGGNIQFAAQSTTEADYLIKLVFILGGGWAVVKSGPMVTQLLSYQAAMTERENNQAGFRAVAGAAAMTGSAVKGLAQVGSQAFKNRKDKKPHFSKQVGPDGKTTTNVNLGKFLKVGYDQKGRYRVKVLGGLVQYKKNNGQKSNKTKVGPLSWKKDGVTGKVKLSGVNMGVFKTKRAEVAAVDADGNKTTRQGDKLKMVSLNTGLFKRTNAFNKDGTDTYNQSMQLGKGKVFKVERKLTADGKGTYDSKVVSFGFEAKSVENNGKVEMKSVKWPGGRPLYKDYTLSKNKEVTTNEGNSEKNKG